jgi:myo-inositol-1(or 4)-monophosphatase
MISINKLTYLAALVIESSKDVTNQNIVKIKNSNDRDVVTELDIVINEALIEHILNVDESAIVFSEEKYVNNFGKVNFKDLTIVIDPLDGTHNYQLGMPYYCVLIAIVFEGRVISSSIVSPSSKDIIIWDNEKITSINPLKSLSSKAPSYFAYPPMLLIDKTSVAIDIFKIIDSGSTGLYRWGSAGCGLLGLIKGQLQSFIGVDVRVWDVLAALPILRQLGCNVAYRCSSVDVISVVASWDLEHYLLLKEKIFLGKNINEKNEIEVAVHE